MTTLAEERAALRALAESLAPHLAGDGYVLRPEGPDTFTQVIAFHHPSGRRFILGNCPTYTKAGRGRFELHGSWPRHPNGRYYSVTDWTGEQAPTPTFRRDRELEELARDIRRRFLSEYERLWALCAEKAAAEEERYTQAWRQLLILADALGVPVEHPGQHQRNPATVTLYAHRDDASSVQATTTSLHFHNLPLATVIHLVALWRGDTNE